MKHDPNHPFYPIHLFTEHFLLFKEGDKQRMSTSISKKTKTPKCPSVWAQPRLTLAHFNVNFNIYKVLLNYVLK